MLYQVLYVIVSSVLYAVILKIVALNPRLIYPYDIFTNANVDFLDFFGKAKLAMLCAVLKFCFTTIQSFFYE